VLPDGCTYHPRGSIEEVGGLTFLYLGGAHSIDQHRRREGVDWWPGENITNDDIKEALSHNVSVDVIVTHDCPDFVPIGSVAKNQWLIENGFDITPRGNRTKLRLLWEKYKPKLWYFGHWHQDFRYIKHTEYPNGTEFVCLSGSTASTKTAVVLDTETLEEQTVTLMR
jgi:hypothetical protein